MSHEYLTSYECTNYCKYFVQSTYLHTMKLNAFSRKNVLFCFAGGLFPVRMGNKRAKIWLTMRRDDPNFRNTNKNNFRTFNMRLYKKGFRLCSLWSIRALDYKRLIWRGLRNAKASPRQREHFENANTASLPDGSGVAAPERRPMARLLIQQSDSLAYLWTPFSLSIEPLLRMCVCFLRQFNLCSMWICSTKCYKI